MALTAATLHDSDSDGHVGEADASKDMKTGTSAALQALSQGVTLPGIPIFSKLEKQRNFMLQHMVGAFRVIARKGYIEGMSGHISLRDPENPQAFWTNP